MSSRSQLETGRRDFLRALALAAGGTALGGLAGCGDAAPAKAKGAAAATSRHGVVLGTGRFQGPDGKLVHTLARMDLDQRDENALRVTPLGFFAHGVIRNPHAAEQVIAFEKHGPGCCLADLREGRVIREIETVAGREFYGHGVHSADGALLYCTETEVDGDYRGVVAVRDARTFELKGTFPTYGTEPHDMVLVDEGRLLAITNGGDAPGGERPPSVTYVDVNSEKLVEELRFSTPRINAGHLAVAPDGDLAVVSAPRKGMMFERDVDDLGGVTLRHGKGEFRTMAGPADVVKRLLRESLSVAIHAPSGTVAVTNPDGNVVSFWNLAEGRFLSALDFPNPKGVAVTLDGAHFLVAHGGGIDLAWVPTATLQTAKVTRIKAPLLSGSHIVMYDPAA
ncbi:MAG: DUF1513 domain-containing protein [Planctomycetota bacterium]